MSFLDQDPFYDDYHGPSRIEAEREMREDLAELSLDDEIWRGMQTGDPLDDVIREIFGVPIEISHPDDNLF